ncbi:MAG: Zn-dependent oxidoreductase, NADPH:quinone reductase [Actinomycetia bacterium]|nr:Zn-dependent oxidoreductase, NADPH:quinone reductase [Actinomycetes bacterium]
MKAVVMREFGPPRVLRVEDVPGPSSDPAAVVIGVEFASVTFVETQVRAGRPPSKAMLPALPAILGNGVGGTVTRAGAEAGPGLLGQRVVAALGGKGGGYAEAAAAAMPGLIEVPDGVELRDATALLADGRTALGLMELARPGSGDTVLVEAAAGGVGTLLVQLARNAGARVVALVGGERKLAVVRDLGADLVVDYSDAGWPSRVREGAGRVDVVFDGVGGGIGLASLGLLGDGGRFCPFGMASGEFTPVGPDLARERGVTVLRSGPPDAERLRALSKAALDEAAAGRIRPVIGQEFGLSQAAAAHEAIESRATIGKTLLAVTR